MGCQNSNMIEVIPVDSEELHQPQPPKQKKTPQPTHLHSNPLPPNGKNKNPSNKENKPSSQISINLNKQAPPPKPENADIAKRKSKSSFNSHKNLATDSANLPKEREEKKKTLILNDKIKTLSAKHIKEKEENHETEIGPSAHSIPPEPESKGERNVQSLNVPIVVEKPTAQKIHILLNQPHNESLSEEIHSMPSRSVKSFKFEVFVEGEGTQQYSNKLQVFIEKEEVDNYLRLIEYGEKEEIMGRIYDQLEKKEEWTDAISKSSKSCQPLMLIVSPRSANPSTHPPKEKGAVESKPKAHEGEGKHISDPIP